MWRMKKPVWVRGKTGIMYSDLCVLEGLVGMFERVSYASSLVEKHRYWPTGIYGDDINVNGEKNTLE